MFVNKIIKKTSIGLIDSISSDNPGPEGDKVVAS